MDLSLFPFVIVVFKSKHTRAGARRGYLKLYSRGWFPPYFSSAGQGPKYYMGRGLGDRNLGIKEACPNDSKGGEAGWEFQVYHLASVISIM